MIRFAVFIFSLFFFSFSKPGSYKTFHINGYAQGTTYNITYYASQKRTDQAKIDSIFKALDQSLSIYQPQSLISQFNNSLNGVELDKHLKTVVQRSLDIYRETNGKFDITVYPLVNAWGFGNQKIKNLPDSSQIKGLLRCIGSDKLEIKKSQLSKKATCLKIDVNGIAQGYSVDVLANYLEQLGVKDYLVEVGGELRIRGRKPNGDFMKIGIESPAAHSNDDPVIKKTVSIKRGAITTSGNYRKFITSDDYKKKLSHLIDPFTGYPLQGSLISATVIAKNAITADGYDNALMAMSIEEALAFVSKKKQMEAYFIYLKKDGTVADTASSGFKKFLINQQ